MKKSAKRQAAGEAPDTLHAGAQDGNVGHHLTELYDIYVRFLSNRTHSKLMDLNLTQWRTLTFVRFNPGRTQRALATAVGIDPSSMTPIIDFFEAKRWVRRHKSTTNRSAYELRMTPTGLKAYQLIEREIGHLEEIIGGLLGARDRVRLAGLLKQVHDGLADRLSADVP